MNINIPDWAIEHFWEEPPEGNWEFWAFRFKPKCQIGDKINFYFQKNLVAQAIVDYIDAEQARKDFEKRFFIETIICNGKG